LPTTDKPVIPHQSFLIGRVCGCGTHPRSLCGLGVRSKEQRPRDQFSPRSRRIEVAILGAAFKECKESPQRRRVRSVPKAPHPQTDLYDPQEPLDVGARLRATRQGCRRIGRERRALPRRRVLLSKNIKIHRRDAEYAACPRRLARKWTFTRRRSPLAGDPAGMPADRTRAPHPSREKGAAIKECKDSPQRRRGATLKGPSKAISLRGCMGTKPLFVFLKNLKNQTIQYDFPLFVRRDQDDFR
jgi:hypothetical protein